MQTKHTAFLTNDISTFHKRALQYYLTFYWTEFNTKPDKPELGNECTWVNVCVYITRVCACESLYALWVRCLNFNALVYCIPLLRLDHKAWWVELLEDGLIKCTLNTLWISLDQICSYLSWVWIIKALQQLNGGALPTSTGSNQSYGLPTRHCQIHSLKNLQRQGTHPTTYLTCIFTCHFTIVRLVILFLLIQLETEHLT